MNTVFCEFFSRSHTPIVCMNASHLTKRLEKRRWLKLDDSFSSSLPLPTKHLAVHSMIVQSNFVPSKNIPPSPMCVCQCTSLLKRQESREGEEEDLK